MRWSWEILEQDCTFAGKIRQVTVKLKKGIVDLLHVCPERNRVCSFQPFVAERLRG